MINPVKIRFACSDFWEGVSIDLNKFKPEKEFSDQVFGWYEGEYISILKTTISSNVIEERN
jgi:hypothetical protein